MTILLCIKLKAQVTTNYNNTKPINERGFYNNHVNQALTLLPAPDTALIIADEHADSTSGIVKPFRFAKAIKTDLDIAKNGDWVFDSIYAYCKLSIKVDKAKSLSLNLDKFFLPDSADMYIYNNKGVMITGPITNKENNPNNKWGSSIYKGDTVTIEVKLPISKIDSLNLHINNIAFGYKLIFSTYSFRNFGDPASCEINVLCPLGDNWQNERNSIALIFANNGTSACSGALINNVCTINLPYLLTANHCLDGTSDVSGWQFIFHYWSPSCSPTKDNNNFLLFNGSVLEANYEPTDFCLLKLNQTPTPNSNITFSGWNNSSTPALSTIGIHHPKGSLMKIASDANAPYAISWPRISGQTHWRAHFQQGTVEPGSSGSPLYDQNHRIIGQLHGDQNNKGYFCSQQIGEYGRFDLSWNGGGTNSTRLRNWLDPLNTGATTTNTSGVDNFVISGSQYLCGISSYSVNNLPLGYSILWSANPSGFITITNPSATVTKIKNINNGVVKLTATLTSSCGISFSISTYLTVGIPSIGGTYTNTFDNTNNTLGIYPYVTNPACTGYYINTNMQIVGAQSVTWSKISSTNVLLFNQNNKDIRFYLFGNNQYGLFKLSASNTCGTTENQFKWLSSYCNSNVPCPNIYAVSPNPTSSNSLKVDAPNTVPNVTAPCNLSFTGLNTLFIKELKVYDNSGSLRKSSQQGGTKHASIDVSSLTTGSYYIEIISINNYKERQIFIKP